MSCRTERPLLACGQQHVRLLGDLALGLSARLEVLQVRDEAEGADPGRVDRRHERVVARLLDQEATVLGEHPAGTPGDVVTGDAVDVRNVVSCRAGS